MPGDVERAEEDLGRFGVATPISEAPPGSSSEPPRAERSTAWRLLRGNGSTVLLAALLLSLLALGYEARRASRFASRVEGLERALTEAEAAVAAHQEHLDAVRGRVAELRDRFDALQSLLARNPDPRAQPRP